MLRAALIIGLGALIAMNSGCSAGPKGDQMKGSAPDITGEWIVIADTSGAGDTGHLYLNADGTFSGDYTTRTGGRTGSAERMSLIRNKLTIALQISETNGRPDPEAHPIHLWYDPNQQVIRDLLTVAYARPPR